MLCSYIGAQVLLLLCDICMVELLYCLWICRLLNWSSTVQLL